MMTYNAAISVLDKAEKWEEALSLFALASQKKMLVASWSEGIN